MRLSSGLLITVFSAFLFSPVMAEPTTIAKTCSQWKQIRQQAAEQTTMYWLEGFIAAYNQYEYRGRHPRGVFKTSDQQVIVKWLDDYCQANPNSNPQEAVESLIEEKKPAQKACPVKKSSGRPCIPSKEEDIEGESEVGVEGEGENTTTEKKNKWLPWG
jgi:hypothetical protein